MRHRAAFLMLLAVVLVVPGATVRGEAMHDTDRVPEFGWVLVSGGSTIATSTDDLNRWDRLKRDDDRVLFARIGADEYVIRDPHFLDRVEHLVEPIRKLEQQTRELLATRAGARADKLERREWKERLRPLKERRHEYLRRVSGDIEDLAREAVHEGRAERVN